MNEAKLKPQTVIHGGRVYEAARKWGIDPGNVIDFSANINPYGPPRGVIEALSNDVGSIRSYPDTSNLVDSISKKIGAAGECIIIGNGSTALIFAAIRALRPRKSLLLEPSFAEYRRGLLSVGSTIETLSLSHENNFLPDWQALNHFLKTVDLMVINNPHNPSGALIKSDDLYQLARRARATDTAVIIDEAFIDYVPESSTLPAITELDNVVVLRSLTKFYSIPGLRVGYAVSHPETASRLREQIESWPVSSLAISAAQAAVSDDAFDEFTRKQNLANRNQFGAELNKLSDLHVFPSAANYLLVKFEKRDCGLLAERLERHHILIRLCDSFEGLGPEWVRLAVLSSEDNMKLVKLIDEWLKVI